MVDVTAFDDGYVVGQQLERDDRQERREAFFRSRYFNDVVGDLTDLFVSYVPQRGATTTTGISCEMRAIGPCFISAAG